MPRKRKHTNRRNGRKRTPQKFSRRVSDYGVPNTSGVFVQPRPMDGIEGPPPSDPLSPSQMPFTPPPGMGKRFIEHISTFQTRLQSYWSKIYLNSDEAYRDSISNATAMRRDPVIMQPLRERQLATVLMDHQVLPEDPKDPIQKKVAEELQRMILHTPRFTMFKLDLMEAIWMSKYGINVVYDLETKKSTALDGTQSITTGMTVRDWIPVHGDKIRHEHESGRIGIMTSRVGWLNDNLDRFQGGIRVTDESRVQMVPLTDHWRQAFIVHKHEVEDGQFYDGFSAGMIHGVGLRTRVYWPWWFKQKLLQWIMEFAERFALGIQIWYYEAGNDESERAVRKAAEEFSSENVIIFPRPIGIEKQGPGYERIEPGMGGTQFFLDMLDGYWGGMIRKMIIGQELTSGIASTGLGSNVAKEHRITFTNIIKFDALNLADTLTEEYLKVLAEYNYPGIDWKPRLKFIVEEPDPKALMETAQMFIELGGHVSENQLREVAKLRKPEEGEQVLGRSAEMPGQQMPGQQQEFDFGPDHAEPSEDMDRPSNATDKSQSEMEMQQYSKDPEKFGWVTTGGHPEGDVRHKEGTPIYIEEGGNISKGPKAIEGKNIKSIDKNVAGTSKDKRRGKSREFPSEEERLEVFDTTKAAEFASHPLVRESINGLSEKQKELIKGYTDEFGFRDSNENYKTLNAALRNRRKEPLNGDQQKLFNEMKATVDEHELPEDTVVYRSINVPSEMADRIVNGLSKIKGKVVNLKSFSSTTLNNELAIQNSMDSRLIFEIIPRHGLYVEQLTEVEGEQEVILNEGTKFRVVDVQRSKMTGDVWDLSNYNIVQLEEV